MAVWELAELTVAQGTEEEFESTPPSFIPILKDAALLHRNAYSDPRKRGYQRYLRNCCATLERDSLIAVSNGVPALPDPARVLVTIYGQSCAEGQ